MASADGTVQDFFSSASADAGGDGEERHEAVATTPLYFGDLLGQIQHKREPSSSGMAEAEPEARVDPSVGVKEEDSEGLIENMRRGGEGACKVELNGSEAWRLHEEVQQQRGEHGAAVEGKIEEDGAGTGGTMMVEDSKESSGQHSRQGNWLVSEILILLEGKAKEEEAAKKQQQQQPRLSADDKWKNVSEYCRSKGVNRSKEQCRVKWDNMMPDFRKIRDHKEQLVRQGGSGGSKKSYFDMDAWERRAYVLPSNMDMEVYLRIAAILSNKPPSKSGGGGGGGGGLKREAREKRSFPPSSSSPPHQTTDVAESLEDDDPSFDRRPHLADIVGKHVAASAPRKRRRRRASCDGPPPTLPSAAALPTSISDCMTTTASAAMIQQQHLDMASIRPPPDPFLAPFPPPPDSPNDSSTEDDDASAPNAVPPASLPPPPPSSQFLFAERSSLPCQKSNSSNDASPRRIQRLLFDANHPESAAATTTMPAAVFAPASQTNGILHNHHHHHHQQPAPASSNPRYAHHAGGGVGSSEEAATAAGAAEMLGHSEERKEARHREMMALEREKLAVFKEATYAMASAMTNAMALFSKMADELLMMRRRRRT